MFRIRAMALAIAAVLFLAIALPALAHVNYIEARYPRAPATGGVKANGRASLAHSGNLRLITSIDRWNGTGWVRVGQLDCGWKFVSADQIYVCVASAPIVYGATYRSNVVAENDGLRHVDTSGSVVLR